MKDVLFYRIKGDKYWDIANAQFAETAPKDGVHYLFANGKVADESYLRETLKFYNLPLGELATDEDLAKEIRDRRNKLLTATDYLMMPDYPISEENLDAIKAYRQALRDVPQQKDFPAEIEWPEMPTVQKL